MRAGQGVERGAPAQKRGARRGASDAPRHDPSGRRRVLGCWPSGALGRTRLHGSTGRGVTSVWAAPVLYRGFCLLGDLAFV